MISCPEDGFATCLPGGILGLWSDPGCTGGTPPLTPTCTPASGSVIQRGTTTVTCTCRDATGGSDSCTFEVTPGDAVPPVVDCNGLDVVMEVPFGSSRVPVPLSSCTATDNSGSATFVSQSPSSGSLFTVGTATVVNVFEDACGNRGTGTFTVTIVPARPPVMISCPDDGFATCLPGGILGLWSDPGCTGGTPPLTPTCTPASGSFLQRGTTTVTCTCSDATGGSDSCTFGVSPSDAVPPVVDCNGLDVVMEVPFGSSRVPVPLPSCTATDNSGSATFVSQSPSSGSLFTVGTATVMNVFEDACGNRGTGTFTVTVVPGAQPVSISCPGDSVAQCRPNDVIGLWSDPVCGGGTPPRTPSCTPSSGSVIGRGATPVTCTCFDSVGQSASCEFTVPAADAIPPVVNCDGLDITRTVSTPTVTVTLPSCTAFDNAGSVSLLSQSPAPGTPFTSGTTPVTNTFIDSCGNIGSDTFDVTIIVIDPCSNIPPCLNGGVCQVNNANQPFCVCTGCFVGDSCQISRQPCSVNQCMNGGTCVAFEDSCEAFSCECPPCFTGITCQTGAVPACRNHECRNNAVCVPVANACDQYTCQCEGCFRGEFCEIPMPNPCDLSPCDNGGMCFSSDAQCDQFFCACPAGFTGDRCENPIVIVINPCNNFPCENDGSCVSMGSVYKCLCRDGYTGINCRDRIGNNLISNPCSSSPCLNGGSCFNSFVSSSGLLNYIPQYTCVCADGFTGDRCVTVSSQSPLLDQCRTNPCSNGGRCLNRYCSFDGEQDFYCDCPIGYIGETCTILFGNPCSLSPCENGGTCMPFNQYFICQCPPEYSGTTCSTPGINPCDPQPCLNSGTCVQSGGDDFICICLMEFQGNVCQIDACQRACPEVFDPVCGTDGVTYDNDCTLSIATCRDPEVTLVSRGQCQAPSPCASQPCLNQGTCLDFGSSFFCICPNTYTGNTCQTATGPCASQPCLNQGTCLDFGASFFCICPNGITGDRCQTVIVPDPCISLPCVNGGTCSNLGDRFECDCPPGFGGVICVTVTDPCSNTPCNNGGTCVVGGTSASGFVCLCQDGFQGQTCSQVSSGPTIDNCPGNIMADFQSTSTNFATVSWTPPTSDDAVFMNSTHIPPTFVQRGDTVDVVYTFADSEGNIDTCSFSILTPAPINPGMPCGSIQCFNGATCVTFSGFSVCSCTDGFMGPTCSDLSDLFP